MRMQHTRREVQLVVRGDTRLDELKQMIIEQGLAGETADMSCLKVCGGVVYTETTRF